MSSLNSFNDFFLKQSITSKNEGNDQGTQKNKFYFLAIHNLICSPCRSRIERKYPHEHFGRTLPLQEPSLGCFGEDKAETQAGVGGKDSKPNTQRTDKARRKQTSHCSPNTGPTFPPFCSLFMLFLSPEMPFQAFPQGIARKRGPMHETCMLQLKLVSPTNLQRPTADVTFSGNPP